jgi:SAM-dependent methyltransferase
VPPRERLGAAEEKARYAHHENDASDAGYRAFLSRLLEPLLAAVGSEAVGLDFGCGPTPVLAEMLRARGHDVAIYDPFFADDAAVWQRSYDFICASEVFEHLHHPAREIDRLVASLCPGGVLAVMTGLSPPSADAFAGWHYIRDPTHVCFFDEAVFRYIAERWQLTPQLAATNVVLLRRA